MWPFSSKTKKDRPMNIRKIDNDFAVTGQITPAQVAEVARAGYKGIVCARPDNEEPGQPNFAEVARAAEQQGIKIAHIPVSGMLGEGQIIRFEQAMTDMGRPVLGYCRSGARAGSLYATLKK